MPELPEIEVIKTVLLNELTGKEIQEPVFTKPYILKSFFKDYQSYFPSLLCHIDRKGKYLFLTLKSNVIIVIHLMRSGRIFISNISTKLNKFIACYIPYNNKRLEIAEYGKEKMAQLYIVKALDEIQGLSSLGIDPFDKSFTEGVLKILLYREKDRLKQFLKNQTKIAGIGNAYSDEILWDSKLSPFTYSHSLKESDISNLYTSIKQVLTHAIKSIEHRSCGTLSRKEQRDFLKVYEKRGKPCPRCNTAIEWVYLKKNTTYYCPHCQTRGKIFKDRRTSKFLK
jgi:formamidopyrimidine-DNA glycosylase